MRFEKKILIFAILLVILILCFVLMYEDNKYIDLTLNNEDSKWQIFSVMTVEKGNNTHMKLRFTDQEWTRHIDWLKSNSLYDTKVDVGTNDNIVILQTCNYNPENTYLLISAKKI